MLSDAMDELCCWWLDHTQVVIVVYGVGFT